MGWGRGGRGRGGGLRFPTEAVCWVQCASLDPDLWTGGWVGPAPPNQSAGRALR